MQFIGDGKPRSRPETEGRFHRLQQTWESDGFGLLAVERLDSGEFIGFSGLGTPDFLPEILPSVEIGWRLAPDHWGLGLGTEAATATLDWALGRDDVKPLVAVIQVDNKRSHRVAEKLGMTRERRTIVPDHKVWVDVYGIDADTWNRR